MNTGYVYVRCTEICCLRNGFKSAGQIQKKEYWRCSKNYLIYPFFQTNTHTYAHNVPYGRVTPHRRLGTLSSTMAPITVTCVTWLRGPDSPSPLALRRLQMILRVPSTPATTALCTDELNWTRYIYTHVIYYNYYGPPKI